MWINEQTQGTFVLHADIRYELYRQGIEAPGVLTDEYLATVGYKLVNRVYPQYDQVLQSLSPLPPVLTDGQWVQNFAVNQLDPASVANNSHMLLALTPEVSSVLAAGGHLERVQAEVEQRRVESLWKAAHDLEFNTISGSAIGLITLGIIQGKPKCLVVKNWINSVWTEYYARKASGSIDLNFSAVAGPCPHSVPELMVELSV